MEGMGEEVLQQNPPPPPTHEEPEQFMDSRYQCRCQRNG